MVYTITLIEAAPRAKVSQKDVTNTVTVSAEPATGTIISPDTKDEQEGKKNKNHTRLNECEFKCKGILPYTGGEYLFSATQCEMDCNDKDGNLDDENVRQTVTLSLAHVNSTMHSDDNSRLVLTGISQN